MMEEFVVIQQVGSKYGVVAMAIFVVYVMIKDIIAPLIRKRNGNGDNYSYRQKLLEELHQWHAPNAAGEQSWKGTQTDRTLKSIDTTMKEQVVEQRKMHSLLYQLLNRGKEG